MRDAAAHEIIDDVGDLQRGAEGEGIRDDCGAGDWGVGVGGTEFEEEGLG